MTDPLPGGAWGIKLKNPNATPDQILAELKGQTPSNNTGVTTVGSPFGDFTGWLPYFLLLTGVLVLSQQTDKYAGLGSAFAALIVATYAFKNWNGISTGFNQTFGTALPGASK